jgi:hypothetical protein
MKHLKLFEDFIENKVEYIHAKMDELQDVLPGILILNIT